MVRQWEQLHNRGIVITFACAPGKRQREVRQRVVGQQAVAELGHLRIVKRARIFSLDRLI
jgi:hypothetical protein